jgi:hypothetical protein
MKSIYIAHPYGGDPSEREDAKRWVREIALLGYAPEAMWCVLTEVLDESSKGLGLQIDRHQVSRCDLILLTGSHVSTGMREEEWEARKRGISVLNLCGLSPVDAWVGKSIAAIIEADGEEQDGHNAAMRDLANVIVERDAYRKALDGLRATSGRERLDLVRRADKAEEERDEALKQLETAREERERGKFFRDNWFLDEARRQRDWGVSVERNGGEKALAAARALLEETRAERNDARKERDDARLLLAESLRERDEARAQRDHANLCARGDTRIGHDPESGCDGGDYGDVCPLVRYDGCLNACAICGETCSRPAPQACPLRNGEVVVTNGS